MIEVIVPPALMIATAVAVVPTPVGPENVTVGAVVNPLPDAVSVTKPTVQLPRYAVPAAPVPSPPVT